jgi:hypothetical protein
LETLLPFSFSCEYKDILQGKRSSVGTSEIEVRKVEYGLKLLEVDVGDTSKYRSPFQGET